MGVGVFSSDFKGTGGTFLVDGLVGGEDEYRAYVLENLPASVMPFEEWKASVAEDPEASEDEYKDYLFEVPSEEAVDFETWQTDQNMSLTSDIEAILATAARELGMTVSTARGGRYERADFDGDFVLVGGDQYVQIGWRSWQHDYVVGVGADSQVFGWVSEPSAHSGEIIDRFGLTKDAFVGIYASLAEHVEEYVRLSLMQAGQDCRFKTSGYTASSYEAPTEGFEAALEALRDSIKQLRGSFPLSFGDGIKTADWADREEIIKTVIDGDTYLTKLAVPMLDGRSGELFLYRADNRRMVAMDGIGEDLTAAVEALAAAHEGTEDMVAVPRPHDGCQSWNDIQSRYPDFLVVSMQEWLDADDDLEPKIQWRDDRDDEWELDVIISAPEPTRVP